MPDLIACHGSRRDFLLRHLGPAFLVAVLLLALETTSIDSAVSNWFFDPVTGAFPLHYNAALEILGHQWPKQLAYVLACCVVATYLLSFVLPALKPQRRLLLFMSLALTLAPLAVVLLKAASLRHCPWSLREFGGFAQHLSLFDTAPPGLSPGHCFPGGHASAGFCLFAFYFAGLALGNLRLARAGLWGGFVAGMALGMVRVVQGAHFISHNLWSALVCWLVILALYLAIMGRTTPQPALRAG
ncbi:MAG TPA: phosphatase PAP2 family protein [Burkholderiales bacterium]|nr:phosphatase PAP2 family protein [Burkholderiales bacterium]